MKSPKADRVLILTGGMVTAKDPSVWGAVRKQINQLRYARDYWLELKIKAVFAEVIIPMARARKRVLKEGPGNSLHSFFSDRMNIAPPDLTEVALATMLDAEGVEFEVVTVEEVYGDPARADELLARNGVVFLSTTLLRDLSELEPLVRRLKTPSNRVVVGGALAGTICHTWAGMPEVDVLAIGYGEFLVPALAKWIRGEELAAPRFGRIDPKPSGTRFVYSGVPTDLSLDFIPRPDWGLAQRYRGERYPMIHYESVRGCPYRCAFCNYPYLFDDTKFRSKSAAKMAADWEAYKNELGVEYITCLDSLFTMPKRRLTEFCEILIQKNLGIKWICYARADDLCDEEVVKLMRRAGCIQVQIGIESGDENILKNMNKRTDPEKNRQALLNCRKHGLTSVATLIVGFPGETRETIETTYKFIQASPPDFFFVAVFSTRVEGVPILTSPNKEKFGLFTSDASRTMAPYWRHDTMDCLQASELARDLNSRLIGEGIALEGSLFYQHILSYKQELRPALLEMQREAWLKARGTRRVFDGVISLINKRLRNGLERWRKADPALPMAPAAPHVR